MVPLKKSARWVFQAEGEGGPLANVPEFVLLGYDRFTSASPLAEHHHDQCYEFVYVDTGQATWEVEDDSFITHSGMYFHTRPNERHSARMNHIEPCSIWWIILTDPSVSHPWLSLCDTEKKELSTRLRQLPRIGRADHRIRESFHQMRRALEQQDRLTSLTVRHLLLDIVLSLVAPRQATNVSGNLTEAVLSLTEQIQQCPERSWTTREIAQKLCVSESHVYRLFHEIVGQSPASYVTRVRIEKACEQLMQSPISITTLAMELGYKTSQHFSTVFKKYTGKTPAEWRRTKR